MQALVCAMLLLTCISITMLAQVTPSVATSTLDKVHDALTTNEQGWKITRKESIGNRTTYRWEMAGISKAEIHIFTYGSPAEAAAALQQRMMRVQVGPTAKLENLGDEAYIWNDSNRDTGIIRFRKGNFVIDVGASKSAIAKKFSAYTAEALPEK
ncbi:MAG: hypothetical protein J2P41_10210 [Blastocatellia bacterium]|nr:hypothetical protein [Blastocatellia bacterium]